MFKQLLRYCRLSDILFSFTILHFSLYGREKGVGARELALNISEYVSYRNVQRIQFWPLKRERFYKNPQSSQIPSAEKNVLVLQRHVCVFFLSVQDFSTGLDFSSNFQTSRAVSSRRFSLVAMRCGGQFFFCISPVVFLTRNFQCDVVRDI